MSRFILPLVILTLLCTVHAADNTNSTSSGSDVLKLTKQNIDKVINKGWVFVKFYAPWCKHCQAMEEDFKNAASALKGETVLADVDATVEKDLAKRFGVGGLPALKMFSDGHIIADYTGERDAKSMINFVERVKRPSYIDLPDKVAFDAFVHQHSDKNILIAIDLDPTNHTMSQFKTATFTVRDVR